MKEKDWIR